MATVSTSAGPVSYDTRGAGPTIVLLPSGAHDHHDYDGLRDRLPARFRSIAVDWPGHGESPGWSGAADESALTRMVEEVVDTLTPEGAVLVGNSIGGNVAARLAVQRPDLVRALMLIDSGGFERPRLSGRVFCALMSRPRFVRTVYPAFSQWYMRPRTEADRRARATAIGTTRSDAGLKAVTEMWRSFASPDHDLRGRAARITAPTLLIWGRRDPVLPLRAAEAARDLIAGSELVVIESGHSPHTTDPDAVARELIRLATAAAPKASD